MGITLKFPSGEDVELVQGKPIVILGANGAGKTRFSVKIEELNGNNMFHGGFRDNSFLIHRLSAQKSLSLSENIPIKGFEASEKELYIGNATQNSHKFTFRYGSNPAIHPVNDYNAALSLLFAEDAKQLRVGIALQREDEKTGSILKPIQKTVVERVTEIWDSLLPARKIDLSGNEVYVQSTNRYHGKEMSDGERVILYMICQALTLKSGSLLIIDEPELHIHKAIVNKLWDKLEEIRQDCVFMYITHDLSFALSRNIEDVLWLKSFDGTNWDYDFINVNDYSDLPNELLYEIIGTRQKVLFVEGEKNSYDHFLYQEIFKDKGCHVIPCGGCHDVVKFVKSKRAYEKLNSIEVYGIVDRDFRTEAEIDALIADGVYCLSVAEVENLFVVPELLDIIAEQLGCIEGTAQEAKDFIKYLFAQNRDNQIGEAFIKEVNHQLTLKNFSDKHLKPQDIKTCLETDFSFEEIQSFFDIKQRLFDAATTVDEILQIFNFKDLSKKIGAKFGINGNEYPQRVVNLIKKNPNHVRERILVVLSNYIPELPG